jgi:hypothetical protein
MKVAKCMEKNSFFVRTIMAKEGHPTSGFKGDKKNKWEKVPHKRKKSHDEKKSKGGLNKIKCFNYDQLGHMMKDCPKSIKIMQDLCHQGKCFQVKANLNLTLLYGGN